jgi:AcrR family transcriptional regulator
MPSNRTPDLEDERIRRAFTSVVGERGFQGIAAEEVAARADVDVEALCSRYEDVEQLFAATWKSIKEEFLKVTGDAFAAHESWREGMRASAWAFCRFLQTDLHRARIFLVEVHFAGEPVRIDRDRVAEVYTELVHRGNEERRGPPVPREQAEAIIGAIWQTVVTKVRADDLDSLPDAVPEGMFLTVFPYLGAEAAQEELRRGAADIERYRRGEL